ncbi:hypothetical protein [Amycolatopsis pittospori]|uniref:hypothetical protein n=1 Tax=Amycolatopsis pittospori TaxID=2749434 RepID=UPI0015F111A9|nr:hypothetical protein [Amycolatopsis pittospori]
MSVLAAVCSAVITTTLGATPGWNLAGAVLAAAIPPMISASGPRPGMRVGVAVAVTAVSVLVTYGGFTSFAYVTEQQSTFPDPAELFVGGPTKDRRAGIAVSPDILKCTTSGCPRKISIVSTGEAPLKVGKISFDGDSGFGRTGECQGKTLQPQEKCEFGVTFKTEDPGVTRNGRMLIENNATDSPSSVTVEGRTSSLPDLSLSAVGVSCSMQPTRSIAGTGALRVTFKIQLTGALPGRTKPTVRVSARSDTGLSAGFQAVLGAPGKSVTSSVSFPLKTTQVNRTHTLIITLDPRKEIAESDETDNQAKVAITVSGAGVVGSVPRCQSEPA